MLIFLYANISRAFLQNAQLQGATLDYAVLADTLMWGANCVGAHLHWANLSRVSAFSVNFSSADLAHAQFNAAGLVGANFTNAILTDANFAGASFLTANMQNAHCLRTDFNGANIAGVDFSGADLAYANLKGVTDWSNIYSLKSANIYSVTNAPDGFLEWATNRMGAIIYKSVDAWSVTE